MYVSYNGLLWNVMISAGKLSESFSHVFWLLNGVKCIFVMLHEGMEMVLSDRWRDNMGDSQ